MLKNGTILMINEMAQEGKSAYAISKALDIFKATASKYMAEPPKQHGLKGSKKPSILDPFKPRVNELMGLGVFNCVRILEDIQQLGYPGHMSILKAYVSPYRQPRDIPAVRRYETNYGYQAQMDWGVCDYLDGRIPAEELQHEKLKALPAQDIINNYRYEERHVQRDGFVSYDGVLYGVPCQYSGRYVKVRE